MTARLTSEAARALQPGQMLYDHDMKWKGLELRARGTKKSWHLYYRFNGIQRRPKLGEFPSLSIDAAREVARQWLLRIAKGEDPSLERKRLRHAPTVDDLVDHYLEWGEKNYKPSTFDHTSRLMRLYVRPGLGKERVESVTVAQCNALFEKIADGSATIIALTSRPFATSNEKLAAAKKVKGRPSRTNANAVRRYLSKAFALAESDGLKWRARGTNPCQDTSTRTFPTAKRRVHVRRDEFEAVGAALETLRIAYPFHVAAAYTILYCGSRVTELITARRDEMFADDFGSFEIRRKEHKTSRHVAERVIDVPPQAMAEIRRLPVHLNGYIFGPIAELYQPRDSIWQLWNMARENAGIRPEVTVRDLRRTFASVARTIGAKLQDIGQLFQHQNVATTELYAFLFDDKRKELSNRTAERISGLLEGTKG